MAGAVLIVLGGLPGSGKSTIAREVARALGATHLRIDAIENALIHSGELAVPIGAAGYLVAYALAAENLRLGLAVIADSVNPIPLTRAAWRETARKADAPALEVEIFCSDPALHRQRLEARVENMEGQRPITWAEVTARGYQPWTETALRLDTATLSVEECARRIVAACR